MYIGCSMSSKTNIMSVEIQQYYYICLMAFFPGQPG